MSDINNTTTIKYTKCNDCLKKAILMVKTNHYCNGCYKRRVCVLCEDFIEFYGNNPAPLRKRGKCCDKCNATKVIPERLKEFNKNGGV